MDDKAQLLKWLPDIERVYEWANARKAPHTPRRSMTRRIAASPLDQAIDAGLRAVTAIAEDPQADISPEESDGLEALIVMVGRPAIRVEDGTFGSPVPPGWEMLEMHRASIERNLRSVGRIELEGNPMYPWVGTGFVVAPGVIMTNRHVAMAFAASTEKGRWAFQPGIEVSIDYTDVPDNDPPPSFAIRGVIGIHERLDLALLEAEPAKGATPDPLVIIDAHPDSTIQRPVYAIGYPAMDPRNDPAVMQRIFGGIYGVKRLQPGMAGSLLKKEGVFRHDCSTLGGNSGSCVIDVQTGQVLGLHFRGFYMKYNEAVALGLLVDDPLLRSAGVRFASASLAGNGPRAPERDDSRRASR